MTTNTSAADIPQLLQTWKRQNEYILGYPVVQSDSSVFLQIDEIGIVSLCVAIDISSSATDPPTEGPESSLPGTYASACFDTIHDALQYLNGIGTANWIADEKRP